MRRAHDDDDAAAGDHVFAFEAPTNERPERKIALRRRRTSMTTTSLFSTQTRAYSGYRMTNYYELLRHLFGFCQNDLPCSSDKHCTYQSKDYVCTAYPNFSVERKAPPPLPRLRKLSLCRFVRSFAVMGVNELINFYGRHFAIASLSLFRSALLPFQ